MWKFGNGKDERNRGQLEASQKDNFFLKFPNLDVIRVVWMLLLPHNFSTVSMLYIYIYKTIFIYIILLDSVGLETPEIQQIFSILILFVVYLSF